MTANDDNNNNNDNDNKTTTTAAAAAAAAAAQHRLNNANDNKRLTTTDDAETTLKEASDNSSFICVFSNWTNSSLIVDSSIFAWTWPTISSDSAFTLYLTMNDSSNRRWFDDERRLRLLF
jgi:hypothetical protein